MFCGKCGKPLLDDDAFCVNCGAPVRRVAGGSNGGQGAGQHGPQPYGYGQPSAASGGYGGYVSNRVSATGCLGSACTDITSSQGWFGRLLALGLIGGIPILGWFTSGYALRWARRLPLGDRSQMPRAIFEGRNFTIGFFAFLVALLVGIVLGIAGWVLGFVPLIGALAALALTVFASMFAYVLYARMALHDSLEAAFDLPQAWRAYSRSLGGLFCATMIPGLIAGAAAFVIFAIYSAIAAALFLHGPGMPLHHLFESILYGNPLPPHVAQAFFGMALGFVIATYLYAVVAAIASVFANRAVGHWVAQVAPEWADGAPERRPRPMGGAPMPGAAPYQPQPPMAGTPPTAATPYATPPRPAEASPEPSGVAEPTAERPDAAGDLGAFGKESPPSSTDR